MNNSIQTWISAAFKGNGQGEVVPVCNYSIYID